jgi:RAQPRD family integrative conjugative element protein
MYLTKTIKTRFYPIHQIVMGVCIIITVSQPQAGELESAQLANIATEISYLIKRVEEIRGDSKRLPSENIAFRYQDLMNDLETVKRGISDYIGADLRNGRVIEPLDGRYR